MLLRPLTPAAILFLASLGCSQGPARVAAPEWEPEQFADQVLAKLDAGADGALATDELAAAPGLSWGAKYIDDDKDGVLSRDELVARFEFYRKLNIGSISKELEFVYNGRPLPEANVKLIPEFFLEGVLEPASGQTNVLGIANIQAEGVEQTGLRPGYYRITVDSPSVKIPAKFAAADTTPLGVEIPPYSNDPAAYGTIRLQLKD
jgi:hypothetical protein